MGIKIDSRYTSIMILWIFKLKTILKAIFKNLELGNQSACESYEW